MQIDDFIDDFTSKSNRFEIEPLVLLLFVTFCGLSYISWTYGEAGLFPLVFLVTGALALGAHLVAVNLPGEIGEKARSLLNTDVGTIDSVSTDDDEDEDDAGGVSVTNIGIVIVTMGIFYVIFYVGNFLIATPIYILLTGYWLGLRNYYVLAILTVVMTAIVYFVFGGIMNVPILE